MKSIVSIHSSTVVALALAVTLAVMLAPAASAATPTVADGSVNTRVVELGDLNLNSHLGVEKAYKRISTAARQVCTVRNDRSAGIRLLVKKCVAEAVDRAVANVNSPVLTSYYLARQRGGASPTMAARQ